MCSMRNLVILISGRGSNMQALVRARAQEQWPARIQAVISDRADAPGLAFADAQRILNIHPSLLPSFPGLNTHQRALEAGVQLHGATVHFVTPRLDDGPII